MEEMKEADATYLSWLQQLQRLHARVEATPETAQALQDAKAMVTDALDAMQGNTKKA